MVSRKKLANSEGSNGKLSSEELANLIIKSVNTGADGFKITRFGEAEIIESLATEFISTQSPLLDLCIGKPGIPVGRVVTILGPEKSGKSTLGQHLIASAQEMGAFAVLMDTEASFDTDRANNIGINLNNLGWLEADTLEDAFEGIKKILRDTIESGSPYITLMIFDSLSALPTKAELEKSADEASKIAEHSKIVGAQLRVITKMLPRARAVLVIMNQERANIGVMYGPQKTYMAEGPLGYHTSLELKVSPAGTIGDKDSPIGIKSNIRVMRSKIADPFKSCILDNYFESGFDTFASELDALVKLKLIEQSKGWYKIDGGAGFRSSDWEAKREECGYLLELLKKEINGNTEDIDKELSIA